MKLELIIIIIIIVITQIFTLGLTLKQRLRELRNGVLDGNRNEMQFTHYWLFFLCCTANITVALSLALTSLMGMKKKKMKKLCCFVNVFVFHCNPTMYNCIFQHTQHFLSWVFLCLCKYLLSGSSQSEPVNTWQQQVLCIGVNNHNSARIWSKISWWGFTMCIKLTIFSVNYPCSCELFRTTFQFHKTSCKIISVYISFLMKWW